MYILSTELSTGFVDKLFNKIHNWIFGLFMSKSTLTTPENPDDRASYRGRNHDIWVYAIVSYKQVNTIIFQEEQAMTEYRDMREAIVDQAVAIAERSCWEAVRLFDVAAELDITLDDIRPYFREKEDIIDAWFDRADGVMLKVAEQDDFLMLPPRDRLHRLIMAWLDALAAHRMVTRQMIGSKLEPGHIHIQIPAIMRISRTVQWMREAAQRDATFLRRALEETALTTLYLATFTHWMFDESTNAQRTRMFLAQQLQMAEILDQAVYGFWQKKNQSSPQPTAPRKPELLAETTGGLHTVRTASESPMKNAATKSPRQPG